MLQEYYEEEAVEDPDKSHIDGETFEPMGVLEKTTQTIQIVEKTANLATKGIQMISKSQSSKPKHIVS